MTSRGKLIAFLIGVTIAFMLPKRITCGLGSNGCKHILNRGDCEAYEVEPFGFYLLEQVVRTDLGFAYETGDTCRR
jgi:hypothetical protein